MEKSKKRSLESSSSGQDNPSKRARKDEQETFPALPPELWNEILCCFLTTPTCKWKDRLTLMLVCKQWSDLVWHQVTSLDLYTGKLPKTFLLVVARNAARYIRSVYFCELGPEEFRTYAPLFPFVEKLLVPLFSGLTNQDLRCIASFTSLITLALFSYEALPMDDDLVWTLTALPSLMHLYLPHKVTDDAIKRIFLPTDSHRVGPNLQALLLMSCDDVTDVGYQGIATITSLTELVLSKEWLITEEGLYPLLELPKLTKLRLRELFIFNDTVIGNLCERLTSITDLTLENMDEVTDSGILHLSRLTTLISLTLKDPVLISDMKAITSLPTLGSLHLLGATNLTDEGMAGFPSLQKSLVTLELDRCSGLTPQSTITALSPLNKLRTLVIRGNTGVTDQALRFASALSSLRSLVLTECPNITDASAQVLAQHSSLTSLFLRSCGEITDEFLRDLGTSLPSLEELHLGKCSGVTDVGLRHLSSLSALRDIDLWECQGVTNEGVQYLSSLGLHVEL